MAEMFWEQPREGPARVQVTMRRAEIDATADQALWVVIRNSADALKFDNYFAFIEPIMCGRDPLRAQSRFDHVRGKLQLPFPDTEPYRLLKVATEVYMMAHCGVVLGETDQNRNLVSTRNTPLDNPDFEALDDPAVNAEEELRLPGMTDPAGQIPGLWAQYLRAIGGDSRTIPYLDI